MSNDIEIRRLDGLNEQRRAFALFRQAMLGLPDLGKADPEAEGRYLKDGKPLGAFGPSGLVGVVNGYASQIAVPGGRRVSHLSVTHVGVAPQATRQGIASRLLTEQLRRARAEGYVVAGLRASDSRIYGRYGYGTASWTVRQELDLACARPAPSQGQAKTRFVDIGNFDLFRKIADADPAPRPAQLIRWDAWWAMQRLRLDHPSTPHYALVTGPEGAETGFLRFHTEASDNWLISRSRTAIVDDLVAHDAASWQTLIGHLFMQDILHRAIFPASAVDDPLRLLVSDPRSITFSGLRDESWVRPLDVGVLLSARSYRETAVFDIADPVIPENAGVWRIGPEGVRRDQGPAEARLDIGTLAALFFGAQTASLLSQAGKLHAPSPETLERLDALFSTGRLPHSGISF